MDLRVYIYIILYKIYSLYLPLFIILSDWFAVLRVPTRSGQLKYLKPMQRSQNPCLSMFLVLMNIPSMEIPPTVVLKKVVAETEIQIQLRILRFTPSKKSPFTRQKLSKSTSNYSSLWIRCKSIPASIFFLMNRSTDTEWNRVNHWVAAKFQSEFELRWYWEETQESCPDGKACYLFPCHTMAGAMRCQKGHKTSLRMPWIVLRHASGMRLFAMFIRLFVAKIRNKLKQKDTNTPNNPKTSFWALL